MTLTYVGDLSTNLDSVRFYLGDTTSGSGPRPSSANFTDAELNGLITKEGGWRLAVAAGFEILAAQWSAYVDQTEGPHKESLSQTAERYHALAKDWRKRYGSGTSAAGTRHMTRIDGYSDDVAANTT